MKRLSMRKAIVAAVLATMMALVPAAAWAQDGLTAGTGATSNNAFVEQEVNMGVSKTTGRTIPDGKYIISSSQDAQLLVGITGNSTKNKAALSLAEQGGKTQVWRVKYISSSKTYSITNVATKKALTTNGKKVYQAKAIGAGKKGYLTQRWNITAYSRGYGLSSAYKKTVSLQAEGTAGAKLLVKKTANSVKQRFWLFSSKGWKASNVIKNGTYSLKSSAADLMLQVKNGKAKVNTPFVMAKLQKKSPAQMYDISAVSGGRYKIINVSTGLAVGTKGDKIVEKKYKGSNKSMLWIPGVNMDGTVSFKNASSGKYLDIAGGKATRGNAAVQTAAGAELSATQKWIVSPTTTGMTSVHRKGLLKANKQTSDTNYSISVDLSAHELMIFKRNSKNGAWYLFKHWVVSNGIHQATLEWIGTKYQFRYTNPQDKGYSAYYWSGMGGRQYFHSIIYRPGTHSVSDGRLGASVSSGCVRMSLSHAKYIYEEIPGGTRVQRYY